MSRHNTQIRKEISLRIDRDQSAPGCHPGTPLATTLHDFYRKFGLCECAGDARRT
ncbi:MAG TPA: hypothetical protein VHJ78_06995 [Actinomycetota bacterium]|nr:hypothetical protein [Actinomycetota bacterium]